MLDEKQFTVVQRFIQYVKREWKVENSMQGESFEYVALFKKVWSFFSAMTKEVAKSL